MSSIPGIKPREEKILFNEGTRKWVGTKEDGTTFEHYNKTVVQRHVFGEPIIKLPYKVPSRTLDVPEYVQPPELEVNYGVQEPDQGSEGLRFTGLMLWTVFVALFSGGMTYLITKIFI